MKNKNQAYSYLTSMGDIDINLDFDLYIIL